MEGGCHCIHECQGGAERNEDGDDNVEGTTLRKLLRGFERIYREPVAAHAIKEPLTTCGYVHVLNKIKKSFKLRSSVTLATIRVLSGHMWLAATIWGSTESWTVVQCWTVLS